MAVMKRFYIQAIIVFFQIRYTNSADTNKPGRVKILLFQKVILSSVCCPKKRVAFLVASNQKTVKNSLMTQNTK